MKKGSEVGACTRTSTGIVVCKLPSRPIYVEIGNHGVVNNSSNNRYTFQPAIQQHAPSTFQFPISAAASNHSLIENPISMAGISALMSQFQATNRQRVAELAANISSETNANNHPGSDTATILLQPENAKWELAQFKQRCDDQIRQCDEKIKQQKQEDNKQRDDQKIKLQKEEVERYEKFEADLFVVSLSHRLTKCAEMQKISRDNSKKNRHLQKIQHKNRIQKLKRALPRAIKKANASQPPVPPDRPTTTRSAAGRPTPAPTPTPTSTSTGTVGNRPYQRDERLGKGFESSEFLTMWNRVRTNDSTLDRVNHNPRVVSSPGEDRRISPRNNDRTPARNNPPTFTQKLKYTTGFCVGLGLDVLDSLYRGFSFLQSCEDLVDNPRLMNPEFGNTQRAQILSVSNAIGNRLLSLWNHPVDDTINLVKATGRGLINIGSNSLHQLQRSEGQFQAGHHFVAGLQVGCAIYEPLALSFVGSGLVRGSTALLKNTKTLLYSLGDTSIVRRGTRLTESFNLDFRINARRSLWNTGRLTAEFSEVALVQNSLANIKQRGLRAISSELNLGPRIQGIVQDFVTPIRRKNLLDNITHTPMGLKVLSNYQSCSLFDLLRSHS